MTEEWVTKDKQGKKKEEGERKEKKKEIPIKS